jgi:hypothetical protein
MWFDENDSPLLFAGASVIQFFDMLKGEIPYWINGLGEELILNGKRMYHKGRVLTLDIAFGREDEGVQCLMLMLRRVPSFWTFYPLCS